MRRWCRLKTLINNIRHTLVDALDQLIPERARCALMTDADIASCLDQPHAFAVIHFERCKDKMLARSGRGLLSEGEKGWRLISRATISVAPGNGHDAKHGFPDESRSFTTGQTRCPRRSSAPTRNACRASSACFIP